MSAVLVVGSGGREHALAWKLSCSPEVTRLIVAPGNDGYPEKWERWPVDLTGGALEARLERFRELAARAKREGVRIAVIGPDNPLADGIVDVFEAAGVAVFGPRASAARIEASKAFAKELMQAAKVPTARFGVVATAADAEAFLASPAVSKWAGWVVKADGLALGKGVKVCDSLKDATQAARELIAVSGSLVIEEKLLGEEISWLALCDGKRCALFPTARDFKRVGDGDKGPNTGGMGAYSPVADVPASWNERVRREVFEPVLAEMRRRDSEFRGVLYAGLMVDPTQDRISVLEFNARFGDPETQVLMARMKGDVLPWFEAVARGDLSPMIGAHTGNIPVVEDAAVVVVAAAKGYPDSPEKGRKIEFITGLAEQGSAPAGAGADGLPSYFMAGVVKKEDALVTNGGRVLGAVARGRTVEEARVRAYARLSETHFEGMQYRRDIAAGVGAAASAARGERSSH